VSSLLLSVIVATDPPPPEMLLRNSLLLVWQLLRLDILVWMNCQDIRVVVWDKRIETVHRAP
jgi:hypothetical protein